MQTSIQFNNLSSTQLLAVAQALAPESRGIIAARETRVPLMTKIGADGIDLPHDASGWVCARDNLTGTIWMRGDVPGGEMNFERAEAAAAAITLCGWKWGQPTIRQMLSLVSFEDHNPALSKQHQELLEFQSSGYWTGSITPWSSSGARVVFFDSGYSYYDLHDVGFFVRAVRVGQ